MMTRWEAFVRQIHTMPLNKDASAARSLYQLRKQFPGSPAERDKPTLIVSDDESKI